MTIPKKTILIVEDDRSLLSALSDKFKREGLNVLTAENGKIGLKSALKNKPDLIVLDILMPVMDGWALYKELRKDKWGKGAYVLMLTNREPDISWLDEIGKTPYLSCYLMKSDYEITDIVKFAKSMVSHR